MIKKLSIYFLTLFSLLIMVQTNANASEQTKFITSYFVKTGTNSYLVPVEIKNNPGLMGFKINVSYGEGVIINSVSYGAVTEKGTFFDNHIVNSKNNDFDVIWNYSKEIKKDGELFIIGLSIDENFKEEIKLTVSYSSVDTFNGKYESVVIDCGKSLKLKQKEAEKYDLATKNDYIINAKEENSAGIVTNSIKDNNIITIIDDVEKENKIENLNEISEQDKEIIVHEVIKNITGNGKNSLNNLYDISNSLGVNKTYELIKSIYDEQLSEVETIVNGKQNNITDNKNSDNTQHINKKYEMILFILIIVIFIASIVVLLIKRGKDRNDEEK